MNKPIKKIEVKSDESPKSESKFESKSEFSNVKSICETCKGTGISQVKVAANVTPDRCPVCLGTGLKA